VEIDAARAQGEVKMVRERADLEGQKRSAPNAAQKPTARNFAPNAARNCPSCLNALSAPPKFHPARNSAPSAGTKSGASCNFIFSAPLSPRCLSA
jgi:hypothetical protein